MPGKNLVIVGAAHVHLDDHVRIAQEEGWRVAAIHDRDASRRKAWAERLKAEPLADLASLARAGADAALVCSETVHHEADVRAALGRGLPVFCEKPLGPDAPAAERMAAAARRAGLMLDTAFFMRTNGALAGLRERVRAGAIGTVVAARMRFSHDGGYADWLDLEGWMSDPELASYGGFADEAVHAVDWLMWTCGTLSSATGVRGHALGLALDDHGAGIAALPAGGTAVVEAGWTDTAMRLEIDLVGSAGGARLRDGEALVWRRGADEPSWRARLSPLDAGEGLRPFLSAVADTRSVGLVHPDEAVAVNAVIDAFYGR